MGLTAAFSFLVIIATFYLKPQGIVQKRGEIENIITFGWQKNSFVCEDELELIRHTLIYLLTLLQTN
jgi:hypothetical protein